MNKKGTISEEVGFWIPRLVFTIIVSVIVYLVTGMFILSEITVQDADAEIFNQRVLSSRQGISYVDPYTNRVYPGVIDIEKFNDMSSLERAIDYGEDSTYLGAKFILLDKEKRLVSEKVYNEKAYRRIIEGGYEGKGGVEVIDKDLYVMIRDIGGNTEPGYLHSTIIVSRS